MKVIQILPGMNIGGVERGVLDLCCFFKGSDVTNSVVSSGGNLVKTLEEKGIKHYKLAVQHKSLFGVFLIPKLRRIIEEEGIDIVHARSRVPGWIIFFASRNSRANFITTAHGVYKNKFFSEVMGWGKFVICPSKVVARHMKNVFGVPEEKIVIINRWVDLEKFKFLDYKTRHNSNTIVSIGRISQSKGYEHLIKSFSKVVRFNPYLKLKIVGSADKSKLKYLHHLKTLVSRFSLNYNVEFLGFTQNVEGILSQARILVAPSVIEESFGRVVVEAFACGVPVVASNIGGFKEIIENGKDGILFEPANEQAITESILKLLKDSNLAEKITINAKRKVEQLYTMDKCLKETKEVYKAVQSELKILVIKISSLGDVILSFPSLKALRQKFPTAKISLLTLKKYHSLLYDCPYIDEVIFLEDKYKKLINILRITKELRRKAFDYVIDLQNNRLSHLISFFSFPRFSFGYSLRLGWLLTRRIKYDRTVDPLTSQEKILKTLGVTFQEKKLTFWPREQNIPFDLPGRNIIGINISASSRWTSKRWPLKNVIRLIELIYKNLADFQVILIGDKNSAIYAKEIEKSVSAHIINLCGKTALRDLPQVIKKMDIFITPDTANLHLACALDIPTIALFGPTDPKMHAVRWQGLYVFCQNLPCSFCYSSKCKLAPESVCLAKISPQQIFAKIKDIAKI